MLVARQPDPLERLETLYLATQGGVARGNAEAIRAAVVVLREHAHFCGYATPDSRALEAARKFQTQEQEERELIAVARAMTIEERELYLELLERAQARLRSAAKQEDN